MHQVLLIVQILVGIGVVGLVLLQQGRGADAGAAFGSGSSGSMFGSRGPATFLSRATAVLAAVFFANSLGLGYLATQTLDRRSVVERFEPVVSQEIPSEPVPKSGTFVTDVPDAPAAPTGGSDVPSGTAGGASN